MNAKLTVNAIWTKNFSSINAIIRTLIGLGIVALFIANYALNEPVTFLKRLELQAYDTRLRATMPQTIDPRIVIIDIDERSLQIEGRFPWGRDKMALLVKRLFDDYKLKVVGFDILFSEPDTSSGLDKLDALAKTAFKANPDFQKQLDALRPELDFDTRLTAQISKYPVVLAFAATADKVGTDTLKIGALPQSTFSVGTFGDKPLATMEIIGYSGNLKAFQDAAAATGHILPSIDAEDGVLRRIPMFIKYGNGYYDSLSMAVLRTYLDNDPVRIKLRADENDGVAKLKSVQFRGDLIVPVEADSTVLVPFRGNSPMFRYISATDVLQGKLKPGELNGKIAFVGTSAQGLFDLRSTPVGSAYPGVETHANLVSGYLDNSIKHTPPFEFGVKVFTLMIIGIVLAIVLVRLNPVSATLTVITISGLLIAFNLYWWYQGVVLPIAVPLAMIGLLYLLNMAYGFFIEARAKRQITGIFGTYVPKELVEEMAKNPASYSTHGESREMTVLFSDIRNFTTISEGLTPTELTAMMNTYLTDMTQSIQAQRGTIDKYIGDAIMAFWGAPIKDEKHAEHALLAALAMQKRTREISPEFVKRGWPKLEIGVGLNCGVMNVGDMGSTFRRAYTVLGDHVNLASRLEGLTKEYGVGILVSANIVNAVPGMVYRKLDLVRVKGKLEPVAIFEPVGLIGEIAEQVLDEMEQFHRAQDHYKAQRWDDAERLLSALSHADPHRKVYKVYLERVANLRTQAPMANWDGVFTFTSK